MKKKISALLVILILAVSLVSAGCGNDNAAAWPDDKVTAVSSKTAQAESEGKETSQPATQNGDEASVEASEKNTAEAAEDPSGSGSDEATQKSSGSGSDETSQKSSGNSSAEESQASSEKSSGEASQQSSAKTGETSQASEKASSESPEQEPGNSPEEDTLSVSEDGEYTDKEHVALYIHEFGHLPSNFVTKNEAMDAGWNNREGNLNIVLPGKSIGGDKFGNYEGRLPKANGRKYYECDIDFNPDGQTSRPVYRNEKRIIYSNDGLVFYTEDHYETFEQLY